jgi:hypothetical protein
MRDTSDVLASIESKATWLKQDAKFMADFVAMLSVRRDFETRAEAAMDEAERELIEALKSVRQSRKAFNAVPVEPSRAA